MAGGGKSFVSYQKTFGIMRIKTTQKRGLELFKNSNIRDDYSKQKIHSLTTRNPDNPFWIGDDRHLCPKCYNNTNVKDTDTNCSWCGVKIIWL